MVAFGLPAEIVYEGGSCAKIHKRGETFEMCAEDKTPIENELEGTLGRKPTYKELSDYLGVTEQAAKQYPKKKRELMIFGLWIKGATGRCGI